MNQTTIFNCLINELGLKKAVTYTFTGFLALTPHGRVSGRFRVSKKEQSIEINVTGNDTSPVALKVNTVGPPDQRYADLLDNVQQDLNDASSLLDSII